MLTKYRSGIRRTSSVALLISSVMFSLVAANSASAVDSTAPSVPLNVTVTRGNASLTVRWEAPASDGGSSVTG